MGLVEDLKSLADLKNAGLLTDVQFEEAKEKVLRGGAAGEAALPAPAAPPAPVVHVNPQAVLQGLLDGNAMNHDVEACCDLLGKLVGNLVQHPAEAKYRTVKPANQKLAATVFSVEGSHAFMEAVGFTLSDGNYVIAQETVEAASWKAAMEDAILPGLQRVYDMRVCRENQIRRRRALDETRREKIADKTRDGSIIAHCRSELLANDDLPPVLETLTRILRRVLDPPQEPKYRRVKVTEAFRADCWQRSGVQEFLLAICGWDVEEDDGPSSTVPPTVAAVLRDADGLFERQRDGLVFLQAVGEEWERLQEAEEEEKRRNAREQARAIMQARRELQNKSKAAGPPARAPGSAGKRIPVEQALRYLRGESIDGGGDPSQARQEEDLTATNLIGEIVGYVQLHHERQKSESLVNHGRKEVQRLRAKYKQDRDVQYLHDLKEYWEAKVLNPAALGK